MTASSIGREKTLKIIVVVDHLRRFRYCWTSFSAPVSDQMAQDLSDLHTNSDRFFSSKEYVLGDADMKSSNTVIPLFKRGRGGQATVGPKVNLFPLVFLSTDSSYARPTSTTNVPKPRL